MPANSERRRASANSTSSSARSRFPRRSSGMPVTIWRRIPAVAATVFWGTCPCFVACRVMPANVSDTPTSSVGTGHPAARWRYLMAARRAFSVCGLIPRSLSEARNAEKSAPAPGSGESPLFLHQLHQAWTPARWARLVFTAFANLAYACAASLPASRVPSIVGGSTFATASNQAVAASAPSPTGIRDSRKLCPCRRSWAPGSPSC